MDSEEEEEDNYVWICYNCEVTTISSIESGCQKCRKKLHNYQGNQNDLKIKVEKEPIPEHLKDSPYWQCTFCNVTNERNDEFCNACDKETRSDQSIPSRFSQAVRENMLKRQCLACGMLEYHKGGAGFCVECEIDLDDEKEAKRILSQKALKFNQFKCNKCKTLNTVN